MSSLLDLIACNDLTDARILVKLIVDDIGVGSRRYDHYEDSESDDSEEEDASDGGGAAMRAVNLIDFAGRRPTDLDDNPAYLQTSSSADEDLAGASSLDLGRYVRPGATVRQGRNDHWPIALSAQPPLRQQRDTSKLNLHASALQMKPHKAVGGGSSKALSADRRHRPLLRLKRRTRPQSELQRMVILDNLLNEDDDHYDDGRRRVSAYSALKRVPANYHNHSPPAKSRVAAGMRYAGIGKRKVNVRSRVDAGMRYMGIGKRHY